MRGYQPAAALECCPDGRSYLHGCDKDIGPAEMHDLKSGFPEIRVTAQLISRLEAVVVLQLSVCLGNSTESLPVEVDSGDDPAVRP